MSGLLDAIAIASVRTVLPLSRALVDGWAMRTMLREMGWAIDLGELDDALLAEIPGAAAIVVGVTDAAALAQQLADGEAEAGDVVGTVIALVQDLAPEIARIGTFDPAGLITDTASALARASFWTGLALDLPEYLLLRYLRDYQAALRGALRVLGIVVDEERESPFLVDAAPADTVRERLVWDRLTALVGDPDGYLRDLYGWVPGGEIAHLSLIANSVDLLTALGLVARQEPIAARFGPEEPTGFYPPGHPAFGSARQLDVPIAHVVDPATGAVSDFAVLAVPVPTDRSASQPVDGIYLTAQADGALTEPIVLDETWTITARSGFAEPGAVGLVFAPGAAVVHDSGSQAEAGLTLSAAPTDSWRLLGGTSGPRLVLHGLEITIDLREGPPAEVLLAARAAGDPGMELFIDTGDGDGFIAGLLAAVEISVPFELGVTWSSATGFTLDAATGLTVDVPVNRELGPVHLETLHLATIVGTDGFTFTGGITASASLGPLVVSVDNVGLEFELAPPDGGGPLHASLAFKAPDGLGLALDVGVASGGGYLDIDAEAGTYEGVLDLEVMAVGISAVGIIETKAPDVDGWSVFLALFLNLPSIQLGFGFTLNGVGGLVGLNRTLDVEALQAAVRSGALGAALFPEDPIADAPMIIDTFRTMFPPADGRTVFGPVVAIGWGTPTIVEAELGIVISLPDPITIAVLGSITSVLPTRDVDLVAINLDVAGVIDQGAGTLSIDASLHDSHIVGFALSGDMALRADFTDAPSFLLSLGGFHPGFTAPAGFPDLKRLSLAIDAGSILQVRFDSYLALTSNTVQFGAGIFVSAMIEGFGIEGGADFDALVQFSPFLVKTDLGFHVSITAAGLDLAGVWLDISLKGPNPWFVVGSARFKILGIETKVRVDEQIGSRRSEPAVEAADLLGSVRTALSDESAWSTVATSIRDVVAVTSPTADGELVTEPDGIVRVAQQIAPMAIAIEHVGEAPVGAYDSFDLQPGEDGMAATGDVMDWFAPASFFDISSTEGLAAPSFELLKAGIEFGGGDPISGEARPTKLGYEQIVRDPELDDDVVLEEEYLPLDGNHKLAATAFGTFAAADLAVTIDNESFAVMPTDVVVTHGRSGQVLATTSSWSAAHQSVANAGSNVLREQWEVPA